VFFCEIAITQKNTKQAQKTQRNTQPFTNNSVTLNPVEPFIEGQSQKTGNRNDNSDD
jgi:hypothetical protein